MVDIKNSTFILPFNDFEALVIPEQLVFPSVVVVLLLLDTLQHLSFLGGRTKFVGQILVVKVGRVEVLVLDLEHLVGNVEHVILVRNLLFRD